MVYLYAVTETLEAPLEALRGLDYASLVHLEGDGLTAVVSRIGSAPVEPTPQRLWQHEQVVEALMTRAAVIPVRFSTVFPDEAAVQALLRDSRRSFEKDLARVRGCVELGLRVLRMVEKSNSHGEGASIPCPELLPVEKNGRTYKLAQRAAVMQREALRRRDEIVGELVHRSLADLSVEHWIGSAGGTGILFKAAYLVREEHLGDLQSALRQLMARYRGLHFLGTGPWPPYHFVAPVEPPSLLAEPS